MHAYFCSNNVLSLCLVTDEPSEVEDLKDEPSEVEDEENNEVSGAFIQNILKYIIPLNLNYGGDAICYKRLPRQLQRWCLSFFK